MKQHGRGQRGMEQHTQRHRAVVYTIAGALAVLLALIAYFSSRVSVRPEGLREFGIEAAKLPNEAAELEAVDLADAAASVEPARLAAEVANSAAPSTAAPKSSARDLGRVVDLLGNGIAGLKVTPRNDPSNYLATSDAEGRFVRSPGVDEFQVSDERWYTLRDTEPLPRADGTEVLVIVAPAIRIGGRVEDADGAPVAGAKVMLDMLRFHFATFPEPLDRAHSPHEPAETGTTTDGRFEFTIPVVELTRISASAAERGSASIEAPLESRFDLVLQLKRKVAPAAPHVAGVVVHADGTPAVGAQVRYGDAAAECDAEGKFTLTVGTGHAEGQPLVAMHPGFQAAIVADFWSTVLLSSGDELPFQRLVLGGPTLAIEGRVVDHEGEPQSGWTVQLVDPVLLREGWIPPQCVESLGGRGRVLATTDAKGLFRLDGLQDRAYRLQAHATEPLLRIESAPIPAGARNVQIVIPVDAFFAKIEGRVVSPGGVPIAGVLVSAGLIVFRTKSGYTSEHGEDVVTDGEGRFTLVNVPRERSKIDVGGDAILPATLDLADHVDGRIVHITAARRCHARVAGVPTTMRFMGVRVRDPDGKNLSLMQFQSGGWWSSDQLELVEGGTPVFAVSESASTIVFVGEDGTEVPRTIALIPGEITTVGW